MRISWGYRFCQQSDVWASFEPGVYPKMAVLMGENEYNAYVIFDKPLNNGY